jgi:uncharacterized membrane protein
MNGNSITLSILYLFHMTATVVWSGGLIVLFLDNLPVSTPEKGLKIHLNSQQRKSLFSLTWFCLLVLGATGMFQMSANPAYKGFLAIVNSWSQAILLKHLIIIVLFMTFAYLTGILEPRLTRMKMKSLINQEISNPDLNAISKNENRVIILLFCLLLIVLLFTSLARAA